MAKSLNKVMLIGNLGKDPELRYTPSGVAVATFSIATNESWKDQDGNTQERTEWHNIVAWRKLAEICGEYLKKGKKVYIEGRIQTRSYDDKNTGAKKYITEIVADNLIMLDGGGRAAADNSGGAGFSQQTETPPGIGHPTSGLSSESRPVILKISTQ
jgi:single-strand DNA-binding protein